MFWFTQLQMTLSPTLLLCYTFGELTFLTVYSREMDRFKREKSLIKGNNACMSYIGYCSSYPRGMGTVQVGKSPHKRPSENTAGTFSLSCRCLYIACAYFHKRVESESELTCYTSILVTPRAS